MEDASQAVKELVMLQRALGYAGLDLTDHKTVLNTLADKDKHLDNISTALKWATTKTSRREFLHLISKRIKLSGSQKTIFNTLTRVKSLPNTILITKYIRSNITINDHDSKYRSTISTRKLDALKKLVSRINDNLKEKKFGKDSTVFELVKIKIDRSKTYIEINTRSKKYPIHLWEKS